MDLCDLCWRRVANVREFCFLPGTGSIPPASTKMEQTGMGRQASCTGLSMSQPGQEQRDSKGLVVEERTDPHTRPDGHRTAEEHKTSIMEQNTSTTKACFPPRLKAVMDAWEALPEAIQEGITTMIKLSAKGDT